MINFQEILNTSRKSETYLKFECFLNDESVLRENNVSENKLYDYELLYKETGVLVTFLNDEVIKIKVYFSPTPICKPYKNEFVFGLSHISSENDIKKQFDFPRNLNIAPMRADNIYQFENCLVAFDAMTGEINYAEVV